jgi:hypothetical protein
MLNWFPHPVILPTGCLAAGSSPEPAAAFPQKQLRGAIRAQQNGRSAIEGGIARAGRSAVQRIGQPIFWMKRRAVEGNQRHRARRTAAEDGYPLEVAEGEGIRRAGHCRTSRH